MNSGKDAIQTSSNHIIGHVPGGWFNTVAKTLGAPIDSEDLNPLTG
jgi:hypothetical protein